MVHTEPCTAKHLPHLPQIGVAAMSDAAHFLYMRPHFAQFPEAAVASFAGRILLRVNSPDTVVRVAVADDADPFTDLSLSGGSLGMRGGWKNGVWASEEPSILEGQSRVPEGRILGYSIWTRTWPSHPEAASRLKSLAGSAWPADSISKKFERALRGINDRYTSAFQPNPSEDPVLKAKLRDGVVGQYDSYIKSVTDKVGPTKGWIYCVAVAVDPSFQRRGIGARMMRWGLEQAEKEGVPILLIASSKGSPLYKKLGFRTLGTMTIHGTINVNDLAMVYWPKGYEDVENTISKAQERAGDVAEEVSSAVEAA